MQDRKNADIIEYGSPSSLGRGRRPFRNLMDVLLIMLFFGACCGLPVWLGALDRHISHELQDEDIRCQQNLAKIGAASNSFAACHGGHFPQDLHQLLEDGYLKPEVLVCPRSSDTGLNSSYIYVGAGRTTLDSGKLLLVYERPGHHSGNSQNVLRIDGRIETWSAEKVSQSLNTTK